MSTFGVERSVLNIPPYGLLPGEEKYVGTQGFPFPPDYRGMTADRIALREKVQNPEFQAQIGLLIQALEARFYAKL